MKVFVLNFFILVVYIFGVSCFSEKLTGNDEYGLQKIGLWIFCIVGHIYSNLVYALYSSNKTSQLN